MRKLYPKVAGRGFLLFCLSVFFLLPGILKAQVAVTPANTISNVCVNGGYKTLTDIKIKEGVVADFVGSGQTYVISPPANFEFNPGTGTVTKPLVSDISFVGISVTSSSVTLFYNVIAVPAVIDSLIISGLEVRATGSASSGNITQTSGLPVTVANHGTLTSILPSVTLSPISPVCENASPVALSGGSPGPGSFSGTGVSGSNFYPSVAGVGTHSITYSYTDGNGCVNTANQNVTVNGQPSVTLNAFSQANICKSAAAIALPTGTPGGGVYTGTGISGSNFSPSIAAVGTNTITYTYTDGNGCSNSANRSINVYALPTVTFSSLTDRCVSSPAFTLSGGSPGGGTYSGTGVSGTSFNPGTAGVGNHTITYTYTDGNGCVNSATSDITVNPLPGVTFSGLDPTYCVNNSSVSLAGFPGGGTFSGSGTSGTSFNPGSAGVGGPYSITYSYTDGNGCSNSTSSTTTILSIPTVTITGLDDAYDVNDNFDNISGTQSPSGGTVSVSGPGVSDLSDRFYPSVAGTGVHTIYRTYTAPNGCTVSATKTVNVGNGSSSGAINGLNASYCINSPIANISGSPTPGTFTGPGITNTGSSTATFNPAAAGVGFHNIIYWYDFNIFGTTFTFPFFAYVYVYPLSDVSSYGLASSYCQNSPSVSLSGYPAGGTFNGTGVSGSTFNPSSAGTGAKSVTYTYTNGYGCTSSHTQNTTVHANPTGVDFSGLGTAYCEDAATATLSGTPSGGVFSGTGVTGSNNFSPSLAVGLGGAGSYNIVYTYTDGNGCSNTRSRSTTVNLKPVVSFSGFPANANYCIDAASVSLVGTPGGGTFSAVSSPVGTISGNIFNPGTAGVGTHNVRYDYTDANGCTNFKIESAQVNPLPFVDFAGLDTLYCHVIGQSIPLSGNQPSGPTSIFSGPGIAGSNFFPAIAGVGEHTIQYQYTDANGCYKDTSKTTVVYARPKADYTMSTLCEGDVISFTDISSVISTVQAPSTIDQWTYRFSDGPTYSLQNPSRTFTHGSYTLWMEVETDKGCDTTLISNFTIGPYPIPDFEWSNVCDQDVTSFTNQSTILAGSIITYDWDFDDLGTTSLTSDPTHTFSTPGIFDVIHTITSDKNCESSITKKVFILPKVNTYPYFTDFESGTDGWIATSEYDPNATWELGFPVKSVINSASSGTNCWVTSLNGNHNKDEKSFVYSPCFDFSGMLKPMFSLDINSNTVELNSGAIVQYSLDEGNTWQVIGSVSSGIDWYNRSGISGQLGIQALNQYGWTGNLTNGWLTARHNLNNIAGQNRIRFRVAFGSDGSDNLSEGFAFDDVWIGERTKTVLLEHFTNSSSNFTATENTYVNTLRDNNTQDLVCIQYHTSFPGTDPMNQRNPLDPSGRVLYYGTTQVPRSVLDGNYYNGNTLGITQSIVDKRSLEDPEFLINLTASNDPNSVSATATVTAQQTISNPVTVYLAVVERRVTAVTGSNGETEFQWVLTKLMPDAAGTSFNQNWIAGDNQTVSQIWNYGSGEVYDASQIGIIAFVQDNVTKEVYQAAYIGPEGPTGGPVLSVNNKADVSLQNMSLYPNPASSTAYVVFSEKAKEDLQYVIYDEVGKIAGSGMVSRGDEGIIINTYDLVSGIYVVKVGSENLGANFMKFVVSH